MSTAGTPPESKDAVAARAEAIASNDPTAPAMHAARAVIPDALQPAILSVGALLRESREKLSLSPADIATRLRMGLKQVNALENSEYSALPTGTFLRGFVRNYAKAVGLNADEILALLERTHSGAAAVKASPVVVPSQQNIKVPSPGGELATPRGRAFLAGIVIVLFLAAAWYWWEYVFPHRGEGGRANAVGSQSIAMPQLAAPALDSPALAPSVAPAVDVAIKNPQAETPVTVSIASDPAPTGVAPAAALQSRVVPPATAGTSEAESARVNSAASHAGSSALGFTFSGESWVEVVDGSGKTVLSRRFKAGDAEEVFGRAPFAVVIGNSKSTRMAFNGREFDIEPYTRGAVARVSVK